MFPAVAGSVPCARTGKTGVQLVALVTGHAVASEAKTWIVGATPNPDVASIPVTVIESVAPLRTGLGLATAVKVGVTVSRRKVRVPVPTLPVASTAVARIVATPSGPVTVTV